MTRSARLDVLCEKLSQRTNQNLEIQSPLEIGLSTNLTNRMATHQPRNNFTNATATYALSFACCKKLGIEVEPVWHTTVKVSKASQLALAEIAFTLMGGSLIHDHRFNKIQAGNPSHTNSQSLKEEEKEIFVSNNWFKDILQHSTDTTEARRGTLDFARDMDKQVSDRQLTNNTTKLEDITTEITDKHAELPTMFHETKSRIQALKKQIQIAQHYKTTIKSHIETCTKPTDLRNELMPVP